MAPSAFAGPTTTTTQNQHQLTVPPSGDMGSMDAMQWSIWSARASYPPHIATPSDPPNPLVQSTLLLHRVKCYYTYTHCAYSYQYMYYCNIMYIFLYQQLHDHQKAHHPSLLVHSDPIQGGPVLQVFHSSESGGEEQWRSATAVVTASRGQREEEEDEGTLTGLAEPLLSQQTDEYQTHATIEMLDPK